MTPGRGGRDVHGVPVYDTVSEITSKQRVDASVISVPPAFVRDAAFEAIENGIKLIVIVTERIPRLEVAQLVEYARARQARGSSARTASACCRPGSRASGGMGGAAVSARRAYQPGPDRDHVALRRHDDGDRQHAHGRRARPEHGREHRRRRDRRLDVRGADAAVRGGSGDEGDRHLLASRAGRWRRSSAKYVKEHGSRLPIVAFMAGRFMDEMPGMRFGHAGTIVEGKADTTAEKIARLQDAGISVAEEIEDIPGIVKQRLGEVKADGDGRQTGDVHPRRRRRDRRHRTPSLAKKLAGVCPVDIFAARRRDVAHRRAEPRRVHPLRPLPRRRPGGRRARRQACTTATALLEAQTSTLSRVRSKLKRRADAAAARLSSLPPAAARRYASTGPAPLVLLFILNAVDEFDRAGARRRARTTSASTSRSLTSRWDCCRCAVIFITGCPLTAVGNWADRWSRRNILVIGALIWGSAGLFACDVPDLRAAVLHARAPRCRGRRPLDRRTSACFPTTIPAASVAA